MFQGRILSLAGPALVSYLLLNAAGAAVAIDGPGGALMAGSALLSLIPLWLSRRRVEEGRRRLSFLAISGAIVLAREASPQTPSLPLDLGAAWALPLAGWALLQLALSCPDEPPVLRRRSTKLSLLFGLMALSAATAATLATLPPLSIGGELVVFSPRLRWAASAFMGFALLLALSLRVIRRELGSAPTALAANTFGQLGLLAALVAASTLLWLQVHGRTASEPSASWRLAQGLGWAGLIAGHLSMVDARRPISAGRGVRALITAALSLALWAYLSHLGGPYLWNSLGPPGAAITLLIAATLCATLLWAAIDRILSPFAGRLLRGCDEASNAALSTKNLEELAQSVLGPLRRASASPQAAPLLFTVDPPRVAEIDAAGMVHVRTQELSAPIYDRLRERPGEVIVHGPFQDLLVRRPELRPLVDSLKTLDALCVVPLAIDGELEGALVVPQGRRHVGLTLEEIHQLEFLGSRLCGQVGLFNAGARAQLRTRDLVADKRQAEDLVETLSEKITQLESAANALHGGGTLERYQAPAIAYSKEMRAFTARLQEIAPLNAPILLEAEGGLGADTLARDVHVASGRADGPFLVADCTSVRPERAHAALFGDANTGEPGWLRLAEAGTLVLIDLPALPIAVQTALAHTLATRRARSEGAAGPRAVDARLVAVSRVDIERLVQLSSFAPELSRRLKPTRLRVPPLRERPEDLPSLILLALDRICRRRGRSVLGMDPKASAALAAHSWPGNLDELDSVLERAVAQATGRVVCKADLPPLTGEKTSDPLEGTYAEVEARILDQALQRAAGNKSEAARLLGLARTTFLDKLKRQKHLSVPPAKKE